MVVWDDGIRVDGRKRCEVDSVFVLNFVFWSFEFVSNFDIRISNLLYDIYGTFYQEAVRERTRGQAPSFPRVLFMPFFNLVNI
jgi:hypothetical protein